MIPLLKFEIEGNSMLPTFKSGDTVLAIAYLFGSPKIGDIIVLKREKYIIKRIAKINPSANGKRFFVVGDNEKESTDSRQFGWVRRKEIVGKVVWEISK